MKVLLTGASSYLGARLFWDLRKHHDIVGTFSSHQLCKDFIHLDATKRQEVRRVVNDIHPDIIIHAANNASAKWCEANPQKAIAVNESATQYLVDEAKNIGARMLYVSSFSADDPSTVYGKTKRASEAIVKNMGQEYSIIRPSLIIGMSPNQVNDRPFNRILNNLDKKTPAVYDTSWKFQPTYVRHISEVILAVIKKNYWNRTIEVAVSKLVSRFDIAQDILSHFGIRVTAIDAHDSSLVMTHTLSSLEALGLPTYDYEKMIKLIVDEIRHRENFVLSG